MSYEIIWEQNGVVVRFWGIFDYKENADATLEIYSASQFENLKFAIWDFSDVSEFRMTGEEAGLVASYDQIASSRLQYLKMALLTQDKRIRRICEKYIVRFQGRQTDWEFMVSDSMESIRTWVNF